MDEMIVMKKYVRYHEILQRLGNIPLGEEITLEDKTKEKGLTRSEIQMAFRDKKEEKFEGGILSYLYSISMEYLIWQAQKNTSRKTAEEIAEYIVTAFNSYPQDVVNFLRLFMDCPDDFYRLIGVKPDKNSFLTLAGLWFELYQQNGSGTGG